MKFIAKKIGGSPALVLVESGIYRKTSNGCYYERTQVRGKRTWRSLNTNNLKHAREEYHRRRAGLVKMEKIAPVFVGKVIRKYQADEFPDQHRQKRPARMYALEKRNCENLLKFWERLPVEEVTLANCDRYHDWRCKKVKRGDGHRAVDLDLNTLSNAFYWACRCELVKSNPLATRTRYCTEKHVRHCRETMPTDADQLHALARIFFEERGYRSAVLGWQVLIEAMTGLRTCEALQLRVDAAPYQAGWITPDGKSLCVCRAKGQQNVNPFVQIHSGLRLALDGLFAWKAKHFPKSPWYFPSAIDDEAPVTSAALARALIRASKDIGKKITSHGMRAFYVTVRRSHGINDAQIAFELGHTTGGTTVAAVYGGVPPHWLAGEGPKMSWLPTIASPAWESISSGLKEPPNPAQSSDAPAKCPPQASTACSGASPEQDCPAKGPNGVQSCPSRRKSSGQPPCVITNNSLISLPTPPFSNN